MCGCIKGKAKKQATPNVEYKANGSGTVRLGLKPFFALPVRLPQAIDGKDVIVVASRTKKPPAEEGAYVIIGRNALMDKKHRQQMVDKWPKAFISV
jgi:hypothetical protein